MGGGTLAVLPSKKFKIFSVGGEGFLPGFSIPAMFSFRLVVPCASVTGRLHIPSSGFRIPCCFMRILNFCWQFVLVVAALMMAVAVPAEAARLRVVAPARIATFQVAGNARITVGTDRSATLSNLNVGDRVSIAYDLENGVLVAHHIADGEVPKSTKMSNLSTSVVRHHAAESTYEHIHGIVRSVNAEDGTLTIEYRAR